MRHLSAVEQQWLFKKSDFEHTPSRKAGISYEDELKRRRATIEYIGSLGLRAGHKASGGPTTAPEEVLAVASSMVHRFYMRRSLEDFDEKLIAPTILFITSKTEEESLKLRYIVNACLDKWVPGGVQWVISPEDKENFPPQSREYQSWEKEILAAEEMVLDALCFDLIVKNPWVELKRSMGDIILAGDAGGSRALRAGVQETAKALLIEGYVAPLNILYDASIAALGAFALALAVYRRTSIEEALSGAAEVGEAFGVDVEFSDDEGIKGIDVDLVRGYCDDFLAFGRQGLYDVGYLESLPPSSEAAKPFARIFKENGQAPPSAKKENGETIAQAEKQNGE